MPGVAISGPPLGNSMEKGAADDRDVEIIDIRGAPVQATMEKTVREMLNPNDGQPRRMPTMLLYDKRGLQLFEAITHLEEYYLTNHEIDVLEKNAAEMAARIEPGTFMIELGSGNLRKIKILLQALEDAAKDVEYYALDLSLDELKRTIAQLPRYKHIQCRGLWGTYDDGRGWMGREDVKRRRKCVLHTGSTIGNCAKEAASKFLREFAETMSVDDTLLIGVDGCRDGAKVYEAYNDGWGISHEFVRNSLRHINTALGEVVFEEDDWKITGEFVSDQMGSRHQYWMSPVKNVTVLGTPVGPHERIKLEESWKYNRREAAQLWDAAGLRQVATWVDKDEYGLYMIEKVKMPFSLNPSEYAADSLPSLDEWKTLWAHWDTVTRRMLPSKALMSKPINLRNACIFYLGHIPTFLDMQLTKTMAADAARWGPLAAPTEPAAYSLIFERGIDPDVDNPELCHAHSEIPDEWPHVEDVLKYQERVRARVKAIYRLEEEGEGGLRPEEILGRTVARAVWIGFEHEAMHLETLLYMMLQSDETRPPPGVTTPDWETMAKNARRQRVENDWHRVPRSLIELGMHDPEDSDETGAYFGWDNEKPVRKVDVAEFEIKGRPVTNEEYAKYVVENNVAEKPASWVSLKPPTPAATNGHHPNDPTSTPVAIDGADLKTLLETTGVRTVFGPVPLKYALDWPIFASHDELAGCAAWLGGRIPTADEVHSAYEHADRLLRNQGAASATLDKMVPAVNGHLLHNGVEVTPPGLFADLTVSGAANVGFAHWHPVAVTGGGGRLGGRAEMGGVWEWTSSVIEKHDGFEPMKLYPGYTADFFDGKHNIVLGGSWATIPRIAGRKSFVNWYQRNYPYVWAGARLARDV